MSLNRLIWLAAMLCTVMCERLPGQLPQTIPLRRVAGLLVVDASIDGHRAALLIDTGAWTSMVDSAVAREFGLAPVMIGPHQKVAASLRVGELSERVVLLVRPSVNTGSSRVFAGILGADFFSRYVVRLDLVHNTMTVFEPRGWMYRGPGESVALTLRNGMAVVDALISLGDTSVPARLLVDAGAARLPFMLTSRFARGSRVSIPADSLHVYGMASTVRGAALSHFRRVCSVTIGSMVFERPVVVIAPAVDDVLPDSIADGTLGLGVLEGGVIYLDFARQRLILEREPGHVEPPCQKKK